MPSVAVKELTIQKIYSLKERWKNLRSSDGEAQRRKYGCSPVTLFK